MSSTFHAGRNSPTLRNHTAPTRALRTTLLSLAVWALALVGVACGAPATRGEEAAQTRGESGSENAASTPRPVLLVLSKTDDTLGFVDPETLELETEIGVGHRPHEIVTTPDGRFAYVSNYGSDAPGSSLTFVDLAARKVLHEIDLSPFRRPHGLALTRDGSKLYVTAESNRAVIELDTRSERITREFATEQEVSHMCVLSPDESKLYVSNIGSGSVSVVELSTGNVRLIEVGDGPEGIDVRPDGRQCWVASRDSREVHVIDTATDRAVASFSTGEFPIRLHFTPSGERALVTSYLGDELIVLDVESREEIARVATGDEPIGILVEPDGRHAWVSQSGADRVTRFDLETLEAVGHVQTGVRPDGLAWAVVAPAGGEGSE